ncbi:hypothetical protein HZC33_00950 [Candidatus Wolfebacteria bacterium]|nr:hypothetical protein [Candidatus Wolfebacteria bacterium]
MLIQNLTDATIASLYNVWGGIINFIPSLIGALITLIIGLIIASGFGSLIEKIVESVKLDSLLRKLTIESYLERAGLRLNSAKFLGALVYWFFVIVFILAATDILGLSGLSQFLREVVTYLPNIIIATLVVLASIVIANTMNSVVKASVMGAKLKASKFLGTLVWWIIVVFGLLTAFIQLGVNPALINTVVTGIVAMLAIAGGIAFGLGGKDYATHLISKLRERTE